MISVIIVNYNSGLMLREAVVALARSKIPQDLDVVIVDNASTDDSLALTEASFHENAPLALHLVRNRVNRGFAAACNQGFGRAKGDFILFLNPDCRVEPAALGRTVQALMDKPQAGMAGGMIVNPDGSEQRGCRRAIPSAKHALLDSLGLSKLLPSRYPDFNLTATPLPGTPVEVEAISGAYMMVKRGALEKVGGWDDGYFLHVEDLDLCQRFQTAGYQVIFVPNAVITHHQGACSSARPVWVEWHKHKGMWRFYRKFQAATDPIWMRGLIGLGILTRFATKGGYLFLHRWLDAFQGMWRQYQ